MFIRPELVSLLVTGALLGALFVAVAYLRRRWARAILAGTLLVAALAYVAFAALAGESASWLALELLGVAVYGSFALRGLRGSAWWLAAGWALHPVWDVALQYAGPGAHVAPAWWTVPCLSWDLLTAACIAFRALRTAPPVPALPA